MNNTCWPPYNTGHQWQLQPLCVKGNWTIHQQTNLWSVKLQTGRLVNS